ncbi:MAG: hypothetical protein KKB70_12295 [Proteobacteria bacterium]|nr:hypothetical protein [Pseudomonadota bacterium]
MSQFTVCLSYGIDADSPVEALALALASIKTMSGSVYVEIEAEAGGEGLEGELDLFEEEVARAAS